MELSFGSLQGWSLQVPLAVCLAVWCRLFLSHGVCLYYLLFQLKDASPARSLKSPLATVQQIMCFVDLGQRIAGLGPLQRHHFGSCQDNRHVLGCLIIMDGEKKRKVQDNSSVMKTDLTKSSAF